MIPMIKMKRIFLILTTASVLVGTKAFAQPSVRTDSVRLTLEDCLLYASGYNYARQSVVLNEASREASLDQSRQERLPGVTAGVSENFSHTETSGTNWSGNYDVSANMTLFQGGQITQTIKQNELQYEQTQLQTQQYDNNLTIQVLQSFLTALGNEELLKYQQAVVDASRQQAEEGKIRFQAGQILESDYLLLDAQYATDQDNITTTHINLDNSLVALKNLMAMDLTQPITLVYPDDAILDGMLVLPSQAEVLGRGMETLPDVRISDYNVEIAETGLKISKSGLYPTVSLTGGIGTGHTQNFKNFGTQVSDRFGPQAGVSVSIPIFNRSRTRTAVQQSRIALQQAELERQQSLADIEQTLISEYSNVVSSASKYKASDTRQNAYNSSFQAYSEMFKAGSITTVELLQQQNNYISAMNDYIQNKYTFMLQRKVLDVYMGEQIKM